jgi:uncharacterized membrane protein YgcG
MSDDRGGYRPPPRPKNALDNTKLGLRAPNSVGKFSSLQWAMVGNNPRIIVYTNDPNDTVDYGKIASHLDLPTFYALLRLLKNLCNLPDGQKDRKKIENKKFTWAGGKRSDNPVVTDSIIVGREEDGSIWISVSAPRRPQIKFTFAPPDFHHFCHGDGSPFTLGEASKLFAETYIDLLTHIAIAVNVKEYVHPEKKEDTRGGAGGGNRSGGSGNYGGGGGNRSAGGGRPAAESSVSDVGEDDVPW